MPQLASISRLFNGFSRQGSALLQKYAPFAIRSDLEGAIPAEGMGDLARALLSVRGEASGVALASDLLAAYAQAGQGERAAFLELLADEFGPDETALAQAWQNYRQKGAQALPRLADVAEPPRQELLRRLNLAPGGTAALVAMRADLIDLARRRPGRFDAVDADFVHLFASWFNRGFLRMEEINWDSPARLLERVIRYEAVHDIRGWDDLRNRLDPSDRRCFAFFHPSLPGEPLIFVEVALTIGLADNIQHILRPDRMPMAAEDASTAIFYSISNCQPGLKGISFGHFLIKQVATDLKRVLPNLTSFATLSPVPGFSRWLEVQAEPDLLARLSEPDWCDSDDALLRDRLLTHAIAYFTESCTPQGKPVDPVARFHLGNGARLERIDWLADRSSAGMRQSAGIMVNYLYDLPRIEEHHEAYFHKGTVVLGRPLRKMKNELEMHKKRERITS